MDEACAAIAAHLGEVDEDKINHMSYNWFNDVLAALGKRLNFESISNMYGKTVFDKKGGETINRMISRANPLIKENTTNSAATIMSMPGAMTIINMEDKDSAKKTMGDMSWFEDFMK